LLLAANSAEFGFQAEIDNISHALALLGLEKVSSLAFTIAMAFYMRKSPRRQVLHPVWSHSVASALIAEALGQALHMPLPSLYTAGLMHDIGRLGLLLSEGGKYELILMLVHDSLGEATSLEQVTFGVTHSQAGAVMSESWGIPVPIVECIRGHHGIPEDEPRCSTLLDFTRLACRMATGLGYPELNCMQRESQDSAREGVPAAVRADPLLAPERLAALIKKKLGSVW
jgi:putative nucleotidyltransferase with HDIG domain